MFATVMKPWRREAGTERAAAMSASRSDAAECRTSHAPMLRRPADASARKPLPSPAHNSYAVMTPGRVGARERGRGGAARRAEGTHAARLARAAAGAAPRSPLRPCPAAAAAAAPESGGVAVEAGAAPAAPPPAPSAAAANELPVERDNARAAAVAPAPPADARPWSTAWGMCGTRAPLYWPQRRQSVTSQPLRTRCPRARLASTKGQHQHQQQQQQEQQQSRPRPRCRRG